MQIDRQYGKMLMEDLKNYLNVLENMSVDEKKKNIKSYLKLVKKMYSLVLQNWDFLEEVENIKLIITITKKSEQIISQINRISVKPSLSRSVLYKIFQCREKCLIFLDDLQESDAESAEI